MATASLYTCVVFFTVISCSRLAYGQLNSTFYDLKCDLAPLIVKRAVIEAVEKEKRMGASMLRLHFHDCFVQGCDASVLLDDTKTFIGEKTAGPNANSLRGFDVIDTIKAKLEKVCPGVVSCADILALAARDAVAQSWTVPLGRRDSTTASLRDANKNLPSPSSDLNTLISAFKSQKLSEKDMIALSGGHTIGQARCSSFRSRIYNDANINSSFANSLKANCPSSGGDNHLPPLDVNTIDTFDNTYYKNLKDRKGLLHSDQALVGGSSNALVNTYSTDQSAFFNEFAVAMVNMGNISPLTGSNGQIRKNCRKIN